VWYLQYNFMCDSTAGSVCLGHMGMHLFIATGKGELYGGNGGVTQRQGFMWTLFVVQLQKP
jgi:hypothetical protein